MYRLYQLLFVYLILAAFAACAPGLQVRRAAEATVFKDSALLNAHLGISIADAATGRYLYNYQGDKYFVPASNVKLFTCYAGMKLLGDSLEGMRYARLDSLLVISPTGDPTLLHSDFAEHPVYKFLYQNKDTYKALGVYDTSWRENPLGYGWAWDDYNDEYMVERSVMPVAGNVVFVRLKDSAQRDIEIAAANELAPAKAGPPGPPNVDYFVTVPDFFSPMVNADKTALSLLLLDEKGKSINPKMDIKRGRISNDFYFRHADARFSTAVIPFATLVNYGYNDSAATNITAAQLLSQDLRKPVVTVARSNGQTGEAGIYGSGSFHPLTHVFPGWKSINSQPTDSMLRPMMHRSDNFYAEQTLLMVSQRQLGFMKTAAIIDTILKTSLKDLPQRPKWVDGSGLSRYNLFTPQSLVQLLVKMKAEFGMERIKKILPTGGSGTLRNYYQPLKDSIFAKTGTLSNNCALSGYLITKKGKLLIFSVLANNYQTGATPVRRAVERFLNAVREKN